MNKFSENLKKIRLNKKWTQQDLADKLYVTKQAVSKWESGKGYPDGPMFSKISEVLDISLDMLIKSEKLQLSISEKVDTIIKQNTTKKKISLLIITMMFLSLFLFGIYILILSIHNNNNPNPTVFYNITYYNLEDNEIDHRKIEPNTLLTSHFVSRNGYRFAGWYLDENFNRKAVFPITITTDISLYAKWEPVNPIIKINNQNFFESQSEVFMTDAYYISFDNDVKYYKVIYNSVMEEYNGNNDYPTLKDGLYKIYAQSIYGEIQLQFIVDHTNPTLTVTNGVKPNRYNYYNQTVIVKAEDIGTGFDYMTVKRSYDDVNFETVKQDELILDQSRTYYITVFDKFGNSISQRFEIDLNIPKIEIINNNYSIEESNIVISLNLKLSAFSGIKSLSSDVENYYYNKMTNDEYQLEIKIPIVENKEVYTVKINVNSYSNLVNSKEITVNILNLG